ncbi:2-amino-4-hydroxy-6-hydroxymethyldihydropteridine diphosphokinase [Aliivibrio sifiae]|uniref:2-amino-4-hydroxy-6-hydroxymethyldihydropteridine pyrophosphokinase n=1 Tax=Aliivibrio sifiae TaxID=566293 RepID=A0A2S7XFU0_9GAMM|nr:2-amino-4-hydroxy-6-hydroxymethyldihydropteridine diphosphokinase [Aliivibrio sifiae]PQJ92574.1 2-amino-4-hydroxy-6-hydroxymethyldihydropteridine diphosphokinase [Aliivibrio sifiae]GLR76853.1 2-amino-4-hydroxy-6-hydroxymethyldihydropteridine diphosphokinase [Aliivibrio sifiae]
MIKVIIAIGSNLGNPVEQAKVAIEALHHLPNSKVTATSSLYSSSPMGPQDQPDYINAVVELETNLEPLDLLDLTQKIELEQGRVRKDERWGPRTLDLDIILFGDQTIDNERLTVPHYGMKEREFVLYPLAEIYNDLTFPDGTMLSQLLTQVERNGLTIWKA